MSFTTGAADAAPFAFFAQSTSRTEPIDIRPTRPDEASVRELLDQLDSYLASLYAPEDNHILGIEALLAPEVSFVGAWQGNALIGCGAVRAMAGEAETAGETYGEIKRMMVIPAARGRRIGARLLAALEDAARVRGLARALLETGRDQHEAIRLYERAGYTLRGAFGGYPDNGLSLFYAKKLA